MNLRRVLSLVMLFAAIVSVLEPVIGEARDSEIHHEEQVAITSFHQIHSPADHAHEGPAQSQHSQSGSHQHGSSSDHCTHQHGLGIPAHPHFAFTSPLSISVSPEQDRSVSRTIRPLFHPPQA
jgi:hypothetical protein